MLHAQGESRRMEDRHARSQVARSRRLPHLMEGESAGPVEEGASPPQEYVTDASAPPSRSIPTSTARSVGPPRGRSQWVAQPVIRPRTGESPEWVDIWNPSSGINRKVTGNDATRLIIESGLLVGRCRVLIEQTQVNVERSDLLVRVSRALRLQQRELRAFRNFGAAGRTRRPGPSVNPSSTFEEDRRRRRSSGGCAGRWSEDSRGALA